MKSKSKQPPNKYVEAFKPYLLTLYLAIFITLYLIYGSGDTITSFIMSSNEGDLI